MDEDIPLNVLSKRIAATNPTELHLAQEGQGPTEHPLIHAAPEPTQLTPELTQLAPELTQLPPAQEGLEPVELSPPHAGTEIELPPAEEGLDTIVFPPAEEGLDTQPIELPPYQEGLEPIQLPPTHAATKATGIHPAQEGLDDREAPQSQVPPATLQLILAELKNPLSL